MKFNKDFLEKMHAATSVLRSAGPAAATVLIQRALLGDTDPLTSASSDPLSPSRLPPNSIDSSKKSAALPQRETNYASPPQPVIDAEIVTTDPAEKRGTFINKSCSNHAGTRAYKLYRPRGYDSAQSSQLFPLIIMLHGCKQHPDDFAAGTRMNAFADQRNFFVAYPAQKNVANASNCWNWFEAAHQRRDRGEPSILADLTREVIRDYPIDPSRVYIAGLSAGGAMAAVMGEAYPELFGALGIHSGLAYGAAHDVGSAFMAMKSGAAKTGGYGAVARGRQLPVIIFHGDHDATVNIRNADQVLTQFAPTASSDGGRIVVEKGGVPGGHNFTKSVQFDLEGSAIAELWVIHDMGHAWSGGSAEGSYTDKRGPDATQAMVDFFLQHSKSRQGRQP